MTQRETMPYRPPAGPDTQAATMMAPPPETQATMMAPTPSTQDTMMAQGTGGLPSSQETIAVDGVGSANPATLPPGSTRGYATVLPDVRAEGQNLIIVPRNETRYQDDKILGRGGMGEVKLAQDKDIGRRVAVKRLLDEQNPHAVARFIDEVRTVGSLEHPNIVPIHDVGVDEDGALFFVMKYVEGETLSDIIAKLAAGDAEYHKRFGFEVRIDLFISLMRALQYAHARGLVHRDVKPENIMVGPYGEVVLMDWGIVHHMRSEDRRITEQAISKTMDRASTETVDGAVVGTPQYMSPEQAAGEVAKLDGRSDIYSAMTVLYELLTLRPYIQAGDTAMATILEVQERELPPGNSPDYIHPSQAAVPAEWRHYMVNGLNKDPDKRFYTAEEALSVLEQVRAGEYVACPITFMKANNTKMERFMDRRPLLSMGLIGLAGVTFLGGVAGWAAWLL